MFIRSHRAHLVVKLATGNISLEDRVGTKQPHTHTNTNTHTHTHIHIHTQCVFECHVSKETDPSLVAPFIIYYLKYWV